MDQYDRQVQRAVTLFLHNNKDYLFLKRNSQKKVDPGRLNGIGGRVEIGENYLDTAIRETLEETGYVITPENIQLSGVVTLEGGYAVDWVMCFFKIEIKNKNIPKGFHTKDGDLMWIKQDQVLDTQFELVDDINYCFKDIIVGKETFFLTCQLNENQKIVRTSMGKITKT